MERKLEELADIINVLEQLVKNHLDFDILQV